MAHPRSLPPQDCPEDAELVAGPSQGDGREELPAPLVATEGKGGAGSDRRREGAEDGYSEVQGRESIACPRVV